MEESLSDRIDRERLERKLLLDARQFAESTANPKKAQPTSERRHAELQKTVTQLDAVTTPRSQPATSPANSSGGTLTYYTWKEGGMGTVEIQVKGDFVEL